MPDGQAEAYAVIHLLVPVLAYFPVRYTHGPAPGLFQDPLHVLYHFHAAQDVPDLRHVHRLVKEQLCSPLIRPLYRFRIVGRGQHDDG